MALVALDAVVHTAGPDGERAIPVADFYLLPGDTPERETVLEHGELIVADRGARRAVRRALATT